MATELRIPKLGVSMEEAVLTEWLVANGATVTVGTPVYALETDKSVQEVEAPADGVLTIIGEAGETYPVGELIGRLD